MNIIELAKQAGVNSVYSGGMEWTIEESNTFICTNKAIERFAALVEEAARADEREACAKVCEKPGWNAANWCAKAIRERGEA